MVRLTCDPKSLYAAAQTTRSKLSAVTHGVDRVDKYGGSQLVPVWSDIKDSAATIARTTDKDLIKLQSAIDSFLLAHSDARNPDKLDEVVAELSQQSRVLERYDSREKLSTQLTQLGLHIAKFTQAFEDNVAAADGKVDARVKEATEKARQTRSDLGKIGGKLQDSASETIFDKALATAWSFLSLARGNGVGQAGNSERSNNKETPGQLSSDFINKMGESDVAHQEQARANFDAIMRGKADTPGTMAALGAAANAVDAWIAEQNKLEETFAAVKSEVSLYLSLFVENQGKDKPVSQDAQLALTRHIHKIETTSKELAAYGEILKAAAGVR